MLVAKGETELYEAEVDDGDIYREVILGIVYRGGQDDGIIGLLHISEETNKQKSNLKKKCVLVWTQSPHE